MVEPLQISAGVKLGQFVMEVLAQVYPEWVARREAATQAIRREGIELEAETHKRALDRLLPSNTPHQLQIHIAETLKTTIDAQVEAEQESLQEIFNQAQDQIDSSEQVRDTRPDPVWTARYTRSARYRNSEEAKAEYARILVEEVRKPGAISLRALTILENLDQETAQLFRQLCSLSVTTYRTDGAINDVRVPNLGADTSEEILKPWDLGYARLLRLAEHGLLDVDITTRLDCASCIAFPLPGTDRFGQMPFRFQNAWWVLLPSQYPDSTPNLDIAGVSLSAAGMELSKIIEVVPALDYGDRLARFFHSRSLDMVRANNKKPIYLDRSPPFVTWWGHTQDQRSCGFEAPAPSIITRWPSSPQSPDMAVN